MFILPLLQTTNYKIIEYSIENTQIYNYVKIFIAYTVLFKQFSSDFTSLVFQKLEEVEISIDDELNQFSILTLLATSEITE